MRAIVRSAALLCLAAAFACADAHDDVIAVFAKMAAGLTDVNAAEFMTGVSKDMPDRDTLQNNVIALARNTELSSTIAVENEEPGDQTYKIDLDWFLQIRSLEQDGPITQRRQIIHCELRKEGKKWKVMAIKPLDFFAPIALAR